MYRRRVLAALASVALLLLAAAPVAAGECVIVPSATSVEVGQTVTFSGSGFSNGDHVIITIMPGPVTLTPTFAIADGTFPPQTYQTTVAGSFTASATGHSETPCTTPSVAFTVTPAAGPAPTPTPAPVAPGAPTPAPVAPGTGVIPNVAMEHPSAEPALAALGWLLLASAVMLAIRRRHASVQ